MDYPKNWGLAIVVVALIGIWLLLLRRRRVIVLGAVNAPPTRLPRGAAHSLSAP